MVSEALSGRVIKLNYFGQLKAVAFRENVRLSLAALSLRGASYTSSYKKRKYPRILVKIYMIGISCMYDDDPSQGLTP